MGLGSVSGFTTTFEEYHLLGNVPENSKLRAENPWSIAAMDAVALSSWEAISADSSILRRHEAELMHASFSSCLVIVVIRLRPFQVD